MSDWRDDLRYYKIPSVAPWLGDPVTSWIKGVQYLLKAHRRLGVNMCDVTLDQAMKSRPVTGITKAANQIRSIPS